MEKDIDIAFRIKKINDLMCKKVDNEMQEMDVTFSQHHILIYLIHCKNHVSPLKQLEHEFRVSQATMAGIVKRMEEKGFVKSFSSMKDKRIKMVELTNKGIGICEKSKGHMEKTKSMINDLYTEEELSKFQEYLDRLFEKLDREVE